MFAFHHARHPDSMCVESQARTQALNSESPRSPGTSLAIPRASGHVKTIVSAAYAAAAAAASRRLALMLTSAAALLDALDLQLALDGELLDDHRDDRRGRNGEDRADDAPQRAADEQRDHHGDGADADAALH